MLVYDEDHVFGCLTRGQRQSQGLGGVKEQDTVLELPLLLYITVPSSHTMRGTLRLSADSAVDTGSNI